MSSGLAPAKRRLALEQLGRDRLIELTNRYALDVGDKRVVENHVNALVRSRAVDFGEVLGTLKREELQAICGALGLDQGGREVVPGQGAIPAPIGLAISARRVGQSGPQ